MKIFSTIKLNVNQIKLLNKILFPHFGMVLAKYNTQTTKKRRQKKPKISIDFQIAFWHAHWKEVIIYPLAG